MKIALTIFGVLLESSGFVLAWKELNLEGEALTRFTRRPVTVRPDVLRVGVSVAPGAPNVEGPPPTIEQKVTALEAKVAQLDNDLDRRLLKTAEEFTQRLEHVQTSVSARSEDEIGALARVVESVHQDSSKKRIAIGLFILGTVANGWSQFVS